MAPDAPIDDVIHADPAAPVKRQLAQAGAKLSPHVLAGVKALRQWDDLYEVTDAELQAAVDEATNFRLG